MNTLRRRLVSSTALALLVPLTGPRAQVVDLNDAINKAGRQRMLSQRLSKAWVALGQQAEAARAERVLSDSMAQFDRQLIELKAYAPTPTIRGTYQQLDPVWSEFKSVLVGAKPSPKALASLLALDDRILALAHQGTQQLEQHGGKTLGQLVNVAGRQRMLSQRMAKLQLAVIWRADAPGAKDRITADRREFSAGLDTLATSPLATPAIRNEIMLARQQWVLFENVLGRASGNQPQDAATVFVASENILQVMEQITTLFARSSA
ncbi:MAG: type IV pili methyl-accepting chemotaxis transducer N-terminal domain-containing protein [Burkholderiales bacterium]|nr:type IV pili methyl-accepting chemotaxis transducer N-terminal domain-containing protein [Burkholderiales bacterium]